jgi:hypothetical protein
VSEWSVLDAFVDFHTMCTRQDVDPPEEIVFRDEAHLKKFARACGWYDGLLLKDALPDSICGVKIVLKTGKEDS